MMKLYSPGEIIEHAVKSASNKMINNYSHTEPSWKWVEVKVIGRTPENQVYVEVSPPNRGEDHGCYVHEHAKNRSPNTTGWNVTETAVSNRFKFHRGDLFSLMVDGTGAPTVAETAILYPCRIVDFKDSSVYIQIYSDEVGIAHRLHSSTWRCSSILAQEAPETRSMILPRDTKALRRRPPRSKRECC